MTWTVAAFYRFVALAGLPALQAAARGACEAAGACGTLLLAPEGVNGTVAVPGDDPAPLIAALGRLFGIGRGEVKVSAAAEKPFARLKVRLRREIITLRAPEADPARRAGTYVESRDWNRLIADPAVLLLDTRNAYETAIGSFEGATDPGIGRFTEFKDFAAARLDPGTHRKVAMFCTGGIRCEKASAYLLAHGFEAVFHLKGGILRYLEEVPAEASRWRGACYVFDGRTAVGHGLAESGWNGCFGCGAPLAPADRALPSFEAGVSCRHCAGSLAPGRAAGLRRRHARIMDPRRQAPGRKPTADAAA